MNKDCQLIWESYKTLNTFPKFKVGDWVIATDYFIDDTSNEAAPTTSELTDKIYEVLTPSVNQVTGKITHCYRLEHDKNNEHPLDWYEDDLREYLPEVKDNVDKQSVKDLLDI